MMPYLRRSGYRWRPADGRQGRRAQPRTQLGKVQTARHDGRTVAVEHTIASLGPDVPDGPVRRPLRLFRTDGAGPGVPDDAPAHGPAVAGPRGVPVDVFDVAVVQRAAVREQASRPAH